jgi:hypothetical protein
MRSAPQVPLAREPPSSVSSRKFPHSGGGAGGDGGEGRRTHKHEH